jgi:hypothetical protein
LNGGLVPGYAGPVRLRVTYASAADFLADYRSQIERGGLLVRVVPDPAPQRGATIDLEIATPTGGARLTAQVIQVLAGAGVAVTVDAAALSGLVARAGAAGDRPGAPPRHEIAADEDAAVGDAAVGDATDGDAGPTDGGDAGEAHPAARSRPVDASLAKKVQQALHGDKSQRTALMREHNKMIHGYVVRNPQIQLDEVVAIARMTTVSADVLVFIAGRREWAERPEVAAALVRNPRTPVPLAIRMLDHVQPTELRQLAKQQSVREAIQRAARKKVIG